MTMQSGLNDSIAQTPKHFNNKLPPYKIVDQDNNMLWQGEIDAERHLSLKNGMKIYLVQQGEDGKELKRYPLGCVRFGKYVPNKSSASYHPPEKKKVLPRWYLRRYMPSREEKGMVVGGRD